MLIYDMILCTVNDVTARDKKCGPAWSWFLKNTGTLLEQSWKHFCLRPRQMLRIRLNRERFSGNRETYKSLSINLLCTRAYKNLPT